MPTSIRPLALALTLALAGAAGVAVAGPAAGQDPQGGQAAEPRGRQASPPAARQQATPRARPRSHESHQPRRHSDDQLSDSVRRIERRNRGRVLNAESMPYEGRSVNRIKVIDESGRVRVIVDDPQAAGGKPRTRRDDD